VRDFAAPAMQWILYGALMIVIVFVLPKGIVPAVERWVAKRTQARRKPAEAILAGTAKPGDER
jgi:branched-chain amino acid transport system permease protein